MLGYTKTTPNNNKNKDTSIRDISSWKMEETPTRYLETKIKEDTEHFSSVPNKPCENEQQNYQYKKITASRALSKLKYH